MKMTNYFTDAELHGALMDEVTQVGIILNSLSSDFIQFTSNYIMNKLTYGLPQLLNELQTFESITRQGKNKGSALYADKSSLLKSSTLKGKAPTNKERRTSREVEKEKRRSVKWWENATTVTLKAIGRGTVLCT